MPTPSATWGLRVPNGTDAPPSLPIAIGNLVTDMEGKALPLVGSIASRPSAATTKAGVIFTASDIRKAFVCVHPGAAGTEYWHEMAPKQYKVSTLPTSPSDGDEIIYQSGSYPPWHMMYIASGPRTGWNYIGGAPFTAHDPAGFTAPNPRASIDLTLPAIRFTAPEQGWYTVRAHAYYDTFYTPSTGFSGVEVIFSIVAPAGAPVIQGEEVRELLYNIKGKVPVTAVARVYVTGDASGRQIKPAHQGIPGDQALLKGITFFAEPDLIGSMVT